MDQYERSELEILLANCQIDNRNELFQKLAVPDTDQESLSDAQLLLFAYKKWGVNCPIYILGDFSFAIRDKNTNTIFCARDPIGIRPFYYNFSHKQFSCDSNIESILKDTNASSRHDESFIAGFLKYKFFAHSERTFYEDIKKIPPGHCLLIESGKLKLTRYWFPENVTPVRYENDEEYANALLNLYKEVIKDYVSSPEPIAVELSGGLDSSSIAVLASQALQLQNRPKPLVYCWEPAPNTNDSNHPYIYSLISAVCEKAKLEPQYSLLTQKEIELYLKRGVIPNPSTSVLIHQLTIQRQSQKQGVTTILSGWGGDQCMTSNGSKYYSELVHKKYWRQLFLEAKNIDKNPFAFVIRQTLSNWLPKRTSILNYFKSSQQQEITHINKLFAKQTTSLTPTIQPKIQSVQQSQILQLLDPAMTERLEGAATSGAEHGIVYRYPLLDRRILEFCLGLPANQFRRGKTTRLIARKAFEKILPKEVYSYTDKRDIVRTDEMRDALGNAGKDLAKMVDNLADSRMAKYVDIESLRMQLESEEFKKNAKLGQIRNALLLLNSA